MYSNFKVFKYYVNQLYHIIGIRIIYKSQAIISLMQNLNQLETNLKSLLQSLQSLSHSLSSPQKHKKQNKKSILIKIPKVLLLTSICKYLTMHEIKYLSTTCTDMKNKIFSPFGWKIISRLKTPYAIQVLYVKSELKEKMRKVAAENAMTGFDQVDDEKYIAKQRAKYKTMLLNKYTHYLKSKQKYEACHDKVKTQRAHLLRIKQQINYLENIREQLDEQNKHNKQKLKKLSQGFSSKIKDMDELNDNLSKERTKLQSQKQALAAKIRQYQHQIQMIKQDSQKSKEILKRLKNYLLYKEL